MELEEHLQQTHRHQGEQGGVPQLEKPSRRVLEGIEEQAPADHCLDLDYKYFQQNFKK